MCAARFRNIPRRYWFAVRGRGKLAAKMLQDERTIEVSIHKDEHGLLLKTRDADGFYLALNRMALDGIDIESIAPADDDVLSVYEYLIGNEEVVR